MSTRRVRALSPVERVWLVADRLTPPFVNQLVLEGEGQPLGRPLLESWRAAAARAADAQPGARLVLRGTLGRARWVDSGAPPPVQLVDGSAWDGRGPNGAPFLSTPLDPRQGPTVAILLVDGPAPRVVVRSHHAVMDGRGTLLFVSDLFRALRGEPCEGSAGDTTDIELARALSPPKEAQRKEDCLAPTGAAAPAPPGVVWGRRTVAGRPSQLLPRLAVATAALTRDVAPLGEGRVRFSVPVDLRPRRLGLRSTANLTGMIHVEMPPDATPESFSAALTARIERRDEASWVASLAPLAHSPLWLMTWVGRRAVRRVHRAGRYIASGVLSNVGRVPIASFHAPDFVARSAFFVPPGSDSNPFFLAITGHERGVELALSVPHVLATGGRLDAALDRLAAAIAGP